jgi:hypothetical protein
VPLIQGRHFGSCGVLDQSGPGNTVRLRSLVPIIEKLAMDAQALWSIGRAQLQRLMLMANAAGSAKMQAQRLVAVELVKFLLREHSMALYRARVESGIQVQGDLLGNGKWNMENGKAEVAAS